MKNTFYTCPYCNEEYGDPVDLAHCILSCEEKKKIEEEKKRQEELELTRKTREEEIEAVEKKLNGLIRAYLKDYGSYHTTREFKEAQVPYLFHWYF